MDGDVILEFFADLRAAASGISRQDVVALQLERVSASADNSLVPWLLQGRSAFFENQDVLELVE